MYPNYAALVFVHLEKKKIFNILLSNLQIFSSVETTFDILQNDFLTFIFSQVLQNRCKNEKAANKKVMSCKKAL